MYICIYIMHRLNQQVSFQRIKYPHAHNRILSSTKHVSDALMRMKALIGKH